MRVFKVGVAASSLILVFVLFQNFGSIPRLQSTDVQKNMSESYVPKSSPYDPHLSAKHIEDFYEKNVAFTKEMDRQKYFDYKAFLKENLEKSPLYHRVKAWVDVDAEDDEGDAVSTGAIGLHEDEGGEVKVKVDPLKTKAMLRYVGSFQADLAFIQEDSNLQLKIYKNLDENSQIHFQHDSDEDKTWVQYQLNF